MKLNFKLPYWLTDPERFWQRVAALLGVLVFTLFLICCWLEALNTRYQAGMQASMKVIDSQREIINSQRKTIGQIGDGLNQVMTRLDEMTQEQKAAAAKAAEQASAPQITRTLDADLNGDGIVDWTDFELFSQDWEKSGSGFAADFNHDGKVDWQDFQVLTNEWLKTESWYTGRDNVTEPSRYADGRFPR